MSQGFTQNLDQAPTVRGVDVVNQWGYSITTVDYILGQGDNVVEVDATNNDVNISMPPTPVLGEIHTIVRADSSDNDVAILGNGANLQDENGLASTIYLGKLPASLDLQFNGTIWRIV